MRMEINTINTKEQDKTPHVLIIDSLRLKTNLTNLVSAESLLPSWESWDVFINLIRGFFKRINDTFLSRTVPADQPVGPDRGTDRTECQSRHQAEWVLWLTAQPASDKERSRWSRPPITARDTRVRDTQTRVLPKQTADVSLDVPPSPSKAHLRLVVEFRLGQCFIFCSQPTFPVDFTPFQMQK